MQTPPTWISAATVVTIILLLSCWLPTPAAVPAHLGAPRPAVLSAAGFPATPVSSAIGSPAPTTAPLSGPSLAWVNISVKGASASPYPRMYASEAYDPQLGGVVLFGGLNNASRGSAVPTFNDTWLFANGTWTNLTSRFTPAPPSRWGASLAWDGLDGYLLLFGGRTAASASGPASFVNDTWKLTTSGWSEITTASAPYPRGFAGLTYDPQASAVILFSGGDVDFSNGTIQAFHDTWTYAGGVWTNITLTAGAGAGQASSIAYDPAVDGVVATGIMKPGLICGALNQTWVFANGTWNKTLNDSSPRPGGSLAYDPQNGVLYYVGGCLPTGHTPIALTWAFSNGTWSNLTGQLTSLPAALCCQALAYDPVQKVLLLFSGDRVHPTPNLGYVNWGYAFPVAPLSATVRAVRSIGAAPFSAHLESIRTGGQGPYTFAWNFTDGAPAGTTQNVSHTFVSPGTYNVTYQVADSQGRMINSSLTITVGPPLALSGSVLPSMGEAPLTVTYNGSLSGGYSPYGYAWNFSDGNVAHGANGTHTFTAGGTFFVQLNATDSVGDVALFNTTITVLAPVVAHLSATPTIGLAPLTVTFNGSASGGTGPYSYLWEFGDSTEATGATEVHSYPAGQYVATLVVTDAAGHNSTTRVNVTSLTPISATASAGPSVGVGPLLVTFQSTGHGGLSPYSYDWSFGDGSSGAGSQPTHTFARAGNYTANVTVTDSLGNSATTSVGVEVVAPLSATLSGPAAAIQSAGVPYSVTATGGLAPYSVAWKLGDGSTATGASVTHPYLTPGIYTISFTVTDALAEQVTNSTTVAIVAPMSIRLVAANGSVLLGSPMALTVAVTGGDAPFGYDWSALPSGCSPVDGPVLQCVPVGVGEFSIGVSVTDALGEVSNASVQVAVSAPATTAGGGTSIPGGPLLIVAIVAALVVIVVLTVLLLRGRPRQPTPRAELDANPGPEPPGPQMAEE